MRETMDFDYFYEEQSDSYTFYRIPKMLFTEKLFTDLSTDAKVLYGLLLDRISLSRENGWIDKEGRVYVFYTIRTIKASMRCANTKACGLLKELDAFGLTERKKQGQGKPTIIYLKKFISEGMAEVQTPEKSGSESEADVSDPGNIGVKTTENSGSRPSENPVLDHGESDPNYININNTRRIINTNHISSMKTDLNDEYNAYAEIIRENLAVDTMLERFPQDAEIIVGIYDLVLETVLCQKPSIWISKNEYPTNLVKSKFLKLNNMHLEYVMGCMKENTTKVRNIKNYLLAALFNAPSTMSSYFQSELSHDMASGVV